MKILFKRNSYALYLLFSFSCSFPFASKSLGAPIPATSSSFVISGHMGSFISEHGFSIHADETDWKQSPAPQDNPFIEILYRAPTTHYGVQAGLTLRVDQLEKAQSLKSYVLRWLKDYPRFGFKILDSKPLKVNDQKAFLLDMVNRQTSKQIRQVVFLKDKTAAILTCRDHHQSFSKTVSTCNKIISHFHWTQ
ncbi:MAG: hypothetical protein KDD35_02540 [Bdellovibrionales bacterium]|nr:hypothetical protein [Bdellovibrionales bacterium]